MIQDEWTKPEPDDDRTERLIAAMPSTGPISNTDTASERMATVLCRRKSIVQRHVARVRDLLGSEERDSRWAERLGDAASDLCDEANVVQSIYYLGVGFGTPRVRAERAQAADDWEEEALRWERLSDRARHSAEEKRSREPHVTGCPRCADEKKRASEVQERLFG